MRPDPARILRTCTGVALAAVLAAGLSLTPEAAFGAPTTSLTRYPYLTDVVGGRPRSTGPRPGPRRSAAR